MFDNLSHPTDFDSYPNLNSYLNLQKKRLNKEPNPEVPWLTSAFRAAKDESMSLVHFAGGLASTAEAGVLLALKNEFLNDKLAYPLAKVIDGTQDIASDLFRKSAEDNATASDTEGNHPIVDFLAGALPFVAVSALSGGASLFLRGAEVAESAAAEQAEYAAASNSIDPSSFSVAHLAKEMGINSVIAAQGSLTLDKKGNVSVDPASLTEGIILGGGIPLLGSGAKAWYRSLKRAKILKDIPSEVSSKIIKEKDKNIKFKKNIRPYEDSSEIPSIEPSISINGELSTQDISVPDTANIEKAFRMNSEDLNDKSNLHVSALAVKDMIDQGVIVNGQKYDINDPLLEQQVNKTLDKMGLDKLRRGSEKVALTKTIDAADDNKKLKWNYLIEKANRIPYRSIGAIEGDTGENFLNFSPQDFKPKDLEKLKEASNKDLVAKSLLGIFDRSATHNFDQSLSTLKSIKKSIALHKAGIIDLLNNWKNIDDQKLNNFVRETYLKYAEYFTNPLSSGYLKMTGKFKLFSNLVSCLIGEITAG